MRGCTLCLTIALLVAGCDRGGDAEPAEVLATVRGDPARGEAALAQYGCGACHVIPGLAKASGRVGPPLSDFAQRTWIAGNVYNTAENLAAWIRRPDSIEPGTIMPTLGVTEAEARDMAAYLLLKTATGGFGPPRLLPPSLIHKE